MSIEVSVGEFEPEVVRIRYSAAGRPYLRLTSTDGLVEDLFLERDLKLVAEVPDPRLGETMNRWLVSGDATGRERHFVVVLRDGRKFGARASRDIAAELRGFCGADPLRAPMPAAIPAVAPIARRSAFVPGFIAKLISR
ncbi:hypothetical protein [Methyloraptor flagellatus]|jgi:hypothetical protein|uniref:DUF2442 domain-containing protein n=1 Tax=Methyloraptor flagellatus TaxID=3162530 RepID=A0AAU7XGM4_9HYPH